MNCPLCQADLTLANIDVYKEFNCPNCPVNILYLNDKLHAIYISHLIYTIKIFIGLDKMTVADRIMVWGFLDLEFPKYPLNLKQIINQVDRALKLKAFI